MKPFVVYPVFFCFLILTFASCSSFVVLDEEPPIITEDPEKQDHKKAFKLNDISVTATRSERKTFDTPKAITVVNQEEYAHKNQTVALDGLTEKPGIWLEKRTGTTSDPVIRGFSGGNILALINGNSLTTLWGEGGYAGDDQYGKVDSESVDRIEVIRGPSSVLYGSNALGGVINFILKESPIDYQEEGFDWGGLSKVAYASANDEFRVRQEFYGATKDFKFFLGGTTRHAHDLEGGRGVGTLSPSGGTDYSWDFSGAYRLNEYQEIELTIQDMHRKNIHRYYKPDQDNINDREAMTLTWRANQVNNFIDELKIWGSYQHKTDERTDYGADMVGEAITDSYGLDIQAVSLVGENHRFTYGLHYHQDHGESPDDEQFTWKNLTTGIKEKMAPDSVWSDFGVYVQDEWDVSDVVTLIASGRYDFFHFNSRVDAEYGNYINNNPTIFPAGYNAEEDDYSDNKGALSGGLGILYRLTNNVNLLANYAHGFRLFGPRFGMAYHGGPDHYLAPHPFYDPVENDTFEVGGKVLYDKFAASLITYYSAIRKWQTNVPGSYNGQTMINGSPVYVTSSGKANVYGIEVETETMLNLFNEEIPENWTLGAGFAWNYGNDKANDEPIRHTQPATGILALRWKDSDKERKGWFEFSTQMVRHYHRIPSGRLANDVGYKVDPQDKTSSNIRKDGLPGYTVFNVRGGLDIMKDLSLTVAVENLTDKKYRAAHSRMDAPGINFLTSLTYRF